MEKSLLSTNPKPATEWDPTKCTDIIPEETNLSIAAPELSAEWHPEKNGDLTPADFKPKSNKKVWWLCPEGHEYEAVIGSRVAVNSGCPFCSGRYPIPGATDLATVNPALVAEWHPTKNGDLTPADIRPKSRKKIWWICPEGHEYEARIANRTTQNTGCPFCSKKHPNHGKTSLATGNPALAAEWHPEKNGVLTPHNISLNSARKVWWLCANGHEWEVSPNSRAKRSKCPYCTGKRVIKGKTDLFTTHPELSAEWHPTKNGDLTPEHVSAWSNKKVWWICKRGHEWETLICIRSRGARCPFCAGHKTSPGENDLSTLKPDLAAEWHPTKNGDLKPEYVSANSNKKVWWLCANGHEWESVIRYRNVGKGRCPLCKKKRNN